MNTETVIFCEGYYDRAFWAGMLTHHGCTDPGVQSGKSSRSQILDPWGKAVTSGQFAFHSKRRGFIRIEPCRGVDQLLPRARRRLESAKNGLQPVRRIVICRHADDLGPAVHLPTERDANIARALNSNLKLNTAGEYSSPEFNSVVSIVHWEVPDLQLAGVPAKQTLERIACAAIVQAYPDRGPLVENWLQSLTNVSDGVKSHAWSFMAGWFADSGCERFYGGLWEDNKIAAALTEVLQRTPAWEVALRIAEA